MDKYDVALLFSLSLSFFALGVIFGSHLGKGEIREQAVKDGVAYYDPITREFTFGRLK